MASRGAQPGNLNAAAGKVWTQAVYRALEKRYAGKSRLEALDEIAQRLLDQCEAGDMAALKELGDRIEGKPAQAVTVAGDADAPIKHVFEWAKPANAE